MLRSLGEAARDELLPSLAALDLRMSRVGAENLQYLAGLLGSGLPLTMLALDFRDCSLLRDLQFSRFSRFCSGLVGFVGFGFRV